MTEFSMSKTKRTRKDKLFRFKKILTQPTRNGRLSILIKQENARQIAASLDLSARITEDHLPRQNPEEHAKNGLNKAHISITEPQKRDQTLELMVVITSVETQIWVQPLSGATLLTQRRDGKNAMLLEMINVMKDSMKISVSGQTDHST
jgi:hypothetical protein